LGISHAHGLIPVQKNKNMASTEVKRNKEKWKARYILEEMKTENDLKNSLGKTAAIVGLSVLGGGTLGAVLGKPSFFAGLGITFLGYYKDIPWLAPVGIGMMASSHITSVGNPSVSGFELKNETAKAKERLVSFKDTLMKKTYLDKVFKSKTPGGDETTSGLGTTNDPEQSLSQIEQQLVNSAMAFQRRRGESTSGMEEEMQGHDLNEPDFSGF